MTADVFVALLRFLIIVALYVFLLAVVVVLSRSLGPRRAAKAESVRRVSSRARLVVLDADASGLPSSFDIDGEAVIGRDPGCAVCLPPTYVSGRHARLEFSEGQWWIQDLGSRNKTYINGQLVPVKQPVAASPGDEIAVAGIWLRLADD